ncbi:protein-disulfide reductase DsbD [Vibrio sp. S4M6]|uniref:protein-disulfide reductase DsbD n=1 Tax=Vibrio sinus TaxID=2946865 RepID=UPI00202A13CA|nr:protein-disulfide reductase DsbD [Vibrio sinus]MCL9783521.1 protein-disulfide reductase DsbD [Vibrio sinus]
MRALFSLFVFVIISLSAPAFAQLGDKVSLPGANTSSPTFVPVDQAFEFSHIKQSGVVYLDWQVKPGYYLYQRSIKVQGNKAELGSFIIPQGKPHKDEFFGEVNIYTSPLSIAVPVISQQPGAQLIVEYQGCAKAGFCYPPETKVVDLQPVQLQSSTTPVPPVKSASGTVPASSTAKSSPSSDDSSESMYSKFLGDYWWTPLLFLALGVGLAFTPCVLPMYPILTSIVLGGGRLTHRKAFALSMVYVQGMALTYTILGLIVASAGLQFQAAMQHPYVLIGLSILFVALALSMFGLYSLQLPSKMQTWLNSLSNQQRSGNYLGVFAMGAISGLVCSPCTTAPLSGALLYVAQTGNLFIGGITLYALALGMGIPLMLAAVFGNKLLPKSGDWMNKIKVLFGFILLAAPIFLIERIIPDFWTSILWSILGIAAFGWLYHVKNSFQFGGWRQSLVAIVAILGILFSAQPLLNDWYLPSASKAVSGPQIQFTRIHSVEELNAQLQQAKAEHKPVMLDFYADWCVACKEFEKYTFHDKAVEEKLSQFVLLQVDVTKSQPEDFKLMQKMGVLGLPTIEFWDASGQHLPSAKVTGFKNANAFLAHLNQFNFTNTL